MSAGDLDVSENSEAGRYFFENLPKQSNNNRKEGSAGLLMRLVHP